MGETDTNEGESFGDYCIWAGIVFAVILGGFALWIAYLVDTFVEWIRREKGGWYENIRRLIKWDY